MRLVRTNGFQILLREVGTDSVCTCVEERSGAGLGSFSLSTTIDASRRGNAISSLVIMNRREVEDTRPYRL